MKELDEEVKKQFLLKIEKYDEIIFAHIKIWWSGFEEDMRNIVI